MSEDQDLKTRVVEYLSKVDKTKTKEIAEALKVKKRDVDTIVKDMAKEGKIEFLYIGTSFVKLVK